MISNCKHDNVTFMGMFSMIGCKSKKVRISPLARIPKKNASKRTWELFYEKFVNKIHSKNYRNEFTYL